MKSVKVLGSNPMAGSATSQRSETKLSKLLGSSKELKVSELLIVRDVFRFGQLLLEQRNVSNRRKFSVLMECLPVFQRPGEGLIHP